jgi:hypothetical protein
MPNWSSMCALVAECGAISIFYIWARTPRAAVQPIYRIASEAGDHRRSIEEAGTSGYTRILGDPGLSDRSVWPRSASGMGPRPAALTGCLHSGLAAMPARCTYEPTLWLLSDEVHNNLGRLRPNGYLVCRPLVGLLVVDEQPTDAGWSRAWPNSGTRNGGATLDRAGQLVPALSRCAVSGGEL